MRTKRFKRTKQLKETTNTNSEKSNKRKRIASPNKPLTLLVIIIVGVAGLVVASFLTFYAVIGGQKTDAERFASEYTTVSKDNVFVYRTGEEIMDILENGTGAVFLGFPSCQWCQAFAGYLSEAANEKGLDVIYYYNIEKDRAENTELYQKLVEYLSAYLQYDDEGKERIYVPNVTFVTGGGIIGNDFQSSKDTDGETDPSAYWTEQRIAEFKANVGKFMQEVIDIKKGNCETSCDE